MRKPAPRESWHPASMCQPALTMTKFCLSICTDHLECDGLWQPFCLLFLCTQSFNGWDKHDSMHTDSHVIPYGSASKILPQIH